MLPYFNFLAKLTGRILITCFFIFKSKNFYFLFFVDAFLNHNTYYLLTMKNTYFLYSV